MDNKELPKEEIEALSSDEAFEKLIGMIKEMSRDELIEFMGVIETYKAIEKIKKSE